MKQALQFSGGRDSLAMLYYMMPHLSNIDVIWANSGDAYPETVALMAYIKRFVPRFIVLTDGDAKEWRLKHGLTDENWKLCCADNMWAPMQRFIAAEGYTHVFRGTKACDPVVPVPPGVYDGVRYIFPLWTWSDEDVNDYLGPSLPPQYRVGHFSSLDCMGCTAKEACGGATKHLWDEHRATKIRAAA